MVWLRPGSWRSARIEDIRIWCRTNNAECYEFPVSKFSFRGMPHVSYEPLNGEAGKGAFIARIPRATVVHGSCKGSVYYYVLSRDGTLFTDGLNMQPRYHVGRMDSFIRGFMDPKRVRLDLSGFNDLGSLKGSCVLLGGMTNYYHWLFEYLPRLARLSEFPVHGDVKYIVNTEPSSWQIESLEFLTVPRGRCVGIPARSYVVVEDLIVPSIMPLPEALGFLRTAVLSHTTPQAPARRKLFISRQDSHEVRVQDEFTLRHRMMRRGFEVVVLSDESFCDQVRMFAEASCVVGAHGAGLTNIAFCSSAAHIVEIVNPVNAGYSFFSDIAEKIGMSFKKVHDVENWSRESMEIFESSPTP